jgi:hypothetical protein
MSHLNQSNEGEIGGKDNNGASIAALLEAVQDLTRVTLALHGNFTSKAEAIRKLDELGIPTTRIADIVGMSSKDVSSSLLKARKSQAKGEHNGHESN